ncbi:phosphatidylglycerophosphatase A [Candidatus Omnitrophota bacterium]
MRRFCGLIASVFYIGYTPVAPGSIGSFAALFLYCFIKDNPFLMGLGIVVALTLGLLTTGTAEKFFGAKDASEIIIDEFTGMLISLYLLPATMGYVVAAFLLFRFFDIIKPKPIKNLEKLDGSLGIMADDVMAGIYANLILQFVYRVL